MELLRDEEREEDGLLPDWTARLDTPVLPREKSGGAARAAGTGAETEGPPSGPEVGAAVRSAETDAWDGPDGVSGLDWMEDGLERPHKVVNRDENGYSGSLNGGIWPNGAVERRRLDGMPAPNERDDGAGELEPGAALDGLARALGSSGSVLPEMGRRAGTERAAGAGRLDGTALEAEGWVQAGPEGARAFAELDKAARAEADSGVEWLYRQAVRAEWQTAPAAGAVSAMRLSEPESGPAALTVEELDRAVRRDSRRYDGEMSIY